MIDPSLFPAFAALFGSTSAALLQKAAEKHVQDYFGKVLERVSGVGRKSDLQRAAESAQARAAGAWIEAMLNNLVALGYDAAEHAEFKDSFARLLQDEEVGRELSRPLLDPEDWQGIDVRLLQDGWARLGCKPLPAGFNWSGAASAFDRQVRRQQIVTPELRPLLDSVTLAAIRDELRRQGGARPEIDEQRYAARMRTKYAELRLAAFAPAEEDVPALQMQDLFQPQDVRENPPPIELPWDLRRRLTAKGQEASGNLDLPEELGSERLERARRAYHDQPRRPVLAALAEPANRRCVLLGDPGSGKSTLAQYLLLSLLPPRRAGAQRQHPWSAAFAFHLPLLVELREFIAQRNENHCESFLDFLGLLGKKEGYALDSAWLGGRLRGGPSLVIFDGLDEIFDPAERERVQQEIAGFVGDYPRAAVLVTSRPAGYSDTILRAAGFRHFALQELDESQVENFTRLWFAKVFPHHPAEAEQRIARVLDACKRSPSIRLLAANPLLLTIMAMIARQRDLPRERARFYDYSVEVLCHHWDINRHLEQEGLQLDYLDLDDKKKLLRRIAFRMQAAKQGLAGNFLLGDDLRGELRAFLTEDLNQPPNEVKRITNALIDQLHSRNYILCLYGPDLFGFVHRTFLEYFCADELRRRVHEDPDYSIDRLLDEEIAVHWRDPAWEEVLRLLCGLIGEAHAGRIIAYLTTKANPSWEESVDLDASRHLLLAVRCMAEVKRRHTIAPAAEELLQTILRTFEPRDWSVGQYRLARGLPQVLAEVVGDWPGSEQLRAEFPAAVHRMAESCMAAYLQLAVTLLGAKKAHRGALEALLADSYPPIRNAACEALAHVWPHDPSVQVLLEERVTQDHDRWVRAHALALLVDMTPKDRSVRELLVSYAIHNSEWVIRAQALEYLALTWPQDHSVQELLERRAVQDNDPDTRFRALGSLAKTWPHEQSVRELLEQRAIQDDHPDTRAQALRVLAMTWPQETSVRDLLEARAVHDDDPLPRSEALEQLAALKPQPASVRVLLRRQLHDPHPDVRRAALGVSAKSVNDSNLRVLLSRDLDDEPPYLDPGQPIPEGHLIRAAAELEISISAVNDLLTRHSQSLGWDLRRGLAAEEPPAFIEPDPQA